MGPEAKIEILNHLAPEDFGPKGASAMAVLRRVWSGQVSASMSGAEYYTDEINQIIRAVEKFDRGTRSED